MPSIMRLLAMLYRDACCSYGPIEAPTTLFLLFVCCSVASQHAFRRQASSRQGRQRWRQQHNSSSSGDGWQQQQANDWP